MYSLQKLDSKCLAININKAIELAVPAFDCGLRIVCSRLQDQALIRLRCLVGTSLESFQRSLSNPNKCKIPVVLLLMVVMCIAQPPVVVQVQDAVLRNNRGARPCVAGAYMHN